MNGDFDKRLEEAASKEFFSGHGCLDGDCSHGKQFDCLESSFDAGARWAADYRLQEILEWLRSDGRPACLAVAVEIEQRFMQRRGDR